jgi:hypothetical protein
MYYLTYYASLFRESDGGFNPLQKLYVKTLLLPLITN